MPSEPQSAEVEVVRLTLGPVQTNCFVLGNRATGEAAVIDPAWNGAGILREIQKRNWRVTHILLTHAHWDHWGGCAHLAAETGAPVALSRGDYPLYQRKGGADFFGLPMQPGPEPALWLEPGAALETAGLRFEILALPGHTPGHIGLYERGRGWLFEGDVVFAGSIGRTDFPGGDYQTLMTSIREQILTLPDETVLFNGHGAVTTVGRERMTNPFLADLS
ncbi:MAG: MBL fold metallo-hydrolase [Chloroflexi bacterium]|nr:MBL fold metallo-hydrolase [Chloroflexota bacterium]